MAADRGGLMQLKYGKFQSYALYLEAMDMSLQDLTPSVFSLDDVPGWLGVEGRWTKAHPRD